MRRTYREEILEKTEKVLETVTDAVLAEIFFNVEFCRRPTMTAIDRGLTHLDDVNYQTIKKTIENLLTRGLAKREEKKLVLTEAGLKKLGEVILLKKGMSRKEGEVYLIVYDIADREVLGRNKLRRFLLKNRMAKVQESVYLSPFDSRKILEDFLRENKVSGQVLVTKLGKDSVIGGEGVGGFLRRIYKLEELEKEYKEFVQKFEGSGGMGVIFMFNKIYKKDSRLSREFLPKNWIGARAMDIYRRTLKQLTCR